MNLESAINTIIPLNAWARCDYEEALDMAYAQSAVYAMKERVIIEALKQGHCKLRIVEVERLCKVCKGTGMYERHDPWDDDSYYEYEDCRCCRATGKVTLRFAETTILTAKFHTPRPKAAFLGPIGLDWDKAEETDWSPEQPARILKRTELIGLLNQAERAIFGETLLLHWHDGWHGRNVFEYSLNLGYYDNCFVCGREHALTPFATFGTDIYRPGLEWQQAICGDCEYRAERWPRQWPANLNANWDRGRWITEYPKWAMSCPLPELAHSWDVTEWLARRGIVIGRIPPA